MTRQAVKIIISGNVQGVGFRAHLARQARALNIKGYVHNLSDGSVEAVALGMGNDIKLLTEWCRQGPPLARVKHISVQTLPFDKIDSDYQDFLIKRSS